MTPIVKLYWARSDRAKKLGRYLNLRAAANTRSLVCCGMESATGDRLITSETVAGERERYSASSFRLTGLELVGAAFLALPAAFFDFTLRSLAQRQFDSQPEAGP